MENENRILKILRNNLMRAEKAGIKQYFSIFVRLDDEENGEIALIEHATGVEEFDKVIEEAKENEPRQIIISITSKKTEPRRRSKDYKINFRDADNKNPEDTQEFIQQTIAEQLLKFKDGLSGMEDTGLGMLEERFTHQGEILQLKTEKKINDLEHGKQIEDLKRELAQKDEEIITIKSDLQEVENDFDQLENQFVEYKKNKFAGISDQLSKVGTNALAGLAAKFLPMLTGGGVSGLPDGNNKPGEGGTTVIEDQNEVNMLTEQLREMLNDFTQEQFSNFYNLILLISQDNKVLDKIMAFLKSNEGGASQ